MAGWPPAGPLEDPFGPLIEGLVIVAAGVENFGAVQAAIHKIRSDIGDSGPFDSVGADDGHVVLLEKLEKFGNGETGVADFDGVAELVMIVHIFEGHALFHPRVVI